ncbi:hypothetical protein Q3A80_11680 [Burkholderia sp. SR8]
MNDNPLFYRELRGKGAVRFVACPATLAVPCVSRFVTGAVLVSPA